MENNPQSAVKRGGLNRGARGGGRGRGARGGNGGKGGKGAREGRGRGAENNRSAFEDAQLYQKAPVQKGGDIYMRFVAFAKEISNAFSKSSSELSHSKKKYER